MEREAEEMKKRVNGVKHGSEKEVMIEDDESGMGRGPIKELENVGER